MSQLWPTVNFVMQGSSSFPTISFLKNSKNLLSYIRYEQGTCSSWNLKKLWNWPQKWGRTWPLLRLARVLWNFSSPHVINNIYYVTFSWRMGPHQSLKYKSGTSSEVEMETNAKLKMKKKIHDGLHSQSMFLLPHILLRNALSGSHSTLASSGHNYWGCLFNVLQISWCVKRRRKIDP